MPKGEAGDLAERVDAGIGATRTMNGDTPTLHLCERGLETALNRVSVLLALPATVGRPVVGSGELEGPHGPATLCVAPSYTNCRVGANRVVNPAS